MARKRIKYVDKDEMYTEIVAFTETGEVSEKLHMMFWKMANHIINRARFNRYSPEWKEDMMSSAYIKCVTVVSNGKYDIFRTNPFSYFTTVISNCFLDHTVAEKKQKRIKMRIGQMYGYTDKTGVKTSVQNQKWRDE